jgi:hypothetical protein
LNVSREAIRTFAELTGDDAPIHSDPAFAKRSGFAAPIAQGLLVAAFAEASLSRRGDDAATRPFEIRFQRPVLTDDRLECRAAAAGDGQTSFEVVNQRDEIVARGGTGNALAWSSSAPSDAASQGSSTPADVWYAEDVMEHFEFGEAEIAWGDDAAVDRFGALFRGGDDTTVSPFPAALLFARGFACFLGALLDCPLPEAGSAGHIGDHWRLYRIPGADETVRVRYRAASLNGSRSRPGMAIVGFAIDLCVDAERVLEGEAVIMIPTRPVAG